MHTNVTYFLALHEHLIFQFIHVQRHVHADSPPPKTLISYGARDWVQTSTSPDEISF